MGTRINYFVVLTRGTLRETFATKGAAHQAPQDLLDPLAAAASPTYTSGNRMDLLGCLYETVDRRARFKRLSACWRITNFSAHERLDRTHASVVVDFQSSIQEIALQPFPLIQAIVDGRTGQTLGQRTHLLLPYQKGIQHRVALRLTDGEAFLGRQSFGLPLDCIEAVTEVQSLLRRAAQQSIRVTPTTLSLILERHVIIFATNFSFLKCKFSLSNKV